MFVNSILSSAGQLARLALGVKPAATAGGKASSDATASASAGSTATDAMRKVLADYDVTNISPKAFSEMLQKLRQAGALSEKDYQELASLTADLEQDGATSDQAVNVVSLCSKKLAAAQAKLSSGQAAAAQQATVASLQRQSDWLQKFAQLHAGQSDFGFNTVA